MHKDIIIPSRICHLGLGLGLGLGGKQTSAAGGGGGAPAAPPSGMVGWLKLDDAAVGAFPTVANAGSFSGNWTRNGSKVTLASGGPNGMKYATIDDTTGDDWIHIATTGTLQALFGSQSWMYGIIFRTGVLVTLTGSQYLDRNVIYDSGNAYIGIGVRSAGGNKIVPWHWDADEEKVELDYTADTWRALVVRFDHVAGELYAKINGGSWLPGDQTGLGTMSNRTFVLQLLSRGTGGAEADIAEFLTYQSQSEADGDALMTYLVERAGL